MLMAFLSLLCTGCERAAYYVENNHGAKPVLSFFLLSLPLSSHVPGNRSLSLALSLNELHSAVGVAATWRFSKGVADLWQGHRDLTRQPTHYLTTRARFHQQLCFPSCRSTCTFTTLHWPQSRGSLYLSPPTSTSVCVLRSISESFSPSFSFGVEQGV